MRCASEKAAAVQCVTRSSKWKRRAGAKKDFETEHSGVFAPPGLPLAHVLTAESGLTAPNFGTRRANS
jgi:hypothetical protein